MSVGLPKLLSQREILQLRKDAVADAEAAFKTAKGVRERHAARAMLQRSRRSLNALEEAMDA